MFGSQIELRANRHFDTPAIIKVDISATRSVLILAMKESEQNSQIISSNTISFALAIAIVVPIGLLMREAYLCTTSSLCISEDKQALWTAITGFITAIGITMSIAYSLIQQVQAQERFGKKLKKALKYELRTNLNELLRPGLEPLPDTSAYKRVTENPDYICQYEQFVEVICIDKLAELYIKKWKVFRGKSDKELVSEKLNIILIILDLAGKNHILPEEDIRMIKKELEEFDTTVGKCDEPALWGIHKIFYDIYRKYRDKILDLVDSFVDKAFTP